MLIMPHFFVHQPQKIDEVFDLMARYQSCMKLLAGGTDLLPKLRTGTIKIKHLISLNHLPELNNITYLENDGLVIGAGVRLSKVAEHPVVRQHYPALEYACSVMANARIRNMGTIAGNLVNAAPSADTAGPLLAYQASVVLVERGGRRQLPLSNFFKGFKKTAIEDLEIMEAIRVPTPLNCSGSFYNRFSPDSQVDIATVGVAGFLALDIDGKILAARLALSAVAPTPLRCSESEFLLIGKNPTADLISRSAVAAVRASNPIDDIRATANYRRSMVYVLARGVLNKCLRQAQEGYKRSRRRVDG